MEVDTSLRAKPEPGRLQDIVSLCPDHCPKNGVRALTLAERSAAYRERRKAEFESADRRTRPQRWAGAVQTLADLIDDYQAWRDGLPASFADGDVAASLKAQPGVDPARRGRRRPPPPDTRELPTSRPVLQARYVAVPADVPKLPAEPECGSAGPGRRRPR
jgi:hypothetical protein